MYFYFKRVEIPYLRRGLYWSASLVFGFIALTTIMGSMRSEDDHVLGLGTSLLRLGLDGGGAFIAVQQQQTLDDARRRLKLIVESAKMTTLVQDPPAKAAQDAEKKELEEKIAKLEAMLNKGSFANTLSSALLFALPSALLSALFAWLGSRAAQRRGLPSIAIGS